MLQTVGDMLGIAIERPSFHDKSVGGLGGKRNAREITRHARLEPGSGIDVASLEEHQYSYAEYYSVPESTARQISQICADGGRGVVIGPIVVRAVESAANCDGMAKGAEGWTRLVIGEVRGEGRQWIC